VVLKLDIMTSLTIFLGEVGPMQIILVLAIVLLLFGGKKIPELMKGLGSGVKEFKNAAKEDQPADKKDETKE
jgi:sec-independent protein translocase protein TatA